MFSYKYSGADTENVTFSSVLRYHRHQLNKQQMRSKILEIEKLFDKHDRINWYTHQSVVSREKRSLTDLFLNFKDPYYRKQWHLTNTMELGMDLNVTGVWRQNIMGKGVVVAVVDDFFHLQTNTMELGMDINVTGVWRQNITGKGVVVAVVDDGLEWNNPDLVDNYNKAGSWDINGDDADPMPDPSKASNHHGTRCAGEISAVPNNICGVGVAYGAQVSGLRLLDGPLTDSLEAIAFTKHFQINDIYSCSWGPDDDGRTVDGPHVLAAAALKHGIDFGRHGYGSIYLVASGNGGHAGDNCNYDGYANSIYTITIGSVDETGHMPYYSEKCASMLAVTFSSGGGSDAREIVTTDWTSAMGSDRTGCTEHHTGTSAAAPIAAGLVALMLEVQPCLTWRDVQYIIILTALKVDVDVAQWQRNGAGLWHSHQHGFGLMNAWRLVNAAKIWNQVPWLTAYTYEQNLVNLDIPKGSANPLMVRYTMTAADVNGYDLYVLESVQLTLTLEHPCRGKLEIALDSPHGTRSIIGASRPHDNSTAGFDKWTFTTVRCWGETPLGTWTITISDTDEANKYANGILRSWTLKLFGTPMTVQQFQQRQNLINEAMNGGWLNHSVVCAPPPVISPPDDMMSVRTLKIIVIIGAFCYLFAIYETVEYLFCYNDEKKEHSKLKMLVKRAYKVAGQTLLDNESRSQEVTSETSALLSEDIPMETFPSSFDVARSLESLNSAPADMTLSLNDRHVIKKENIHNELKSSQPKTMSTGYVLLPDTSGESDSEL